MFDPRDSLTIGPVRCAWRGWAPGAPAEALVRPWLAGMLGVPADALPLVRDARGRPRLLAPCARHDPSWSHSGDRLLVGVGEGVRLGVDLERLRPRPRALVLARRFFAPAEAQALSALPEAARETAFVRLWCAKEAVLKAHGRGLAFGLDRLVFVDTIDGLHLLECDTELGPPDCWRVRELAPEPGYLGALAWRPVPSAPPAERP